MTGGAGFVTRTERGGERIREIKKGSWCVKGEKVGLSGDRCLNQMGEIEDTPAS